MGNEGSARLVVCGNPWLAHRLAIMSRMVIACGKDAETQDLMIGRITLHQKTARMLKSYLKS